ncbi:hypothetical protein INT45_009575, partial [Circinella minor]
MSTSNRKGSNSTPQSIGKRRTRSDSPPAVGIRKSRRLMRKAMEKSQISTKENETTAPAISISEEDIIMEEPEIVIVQEEDIDEEPENYYFEFPVDPARLVQDGDYMDSSTDDDTDDDNETIVSSNDEEPQLRSIVTVGPIGGKGTVIPYLARTKRDDRVPKKPHKK